MVLLLSACAGQQAYRDGQALFKQGQVEEGLAKVEEATRQAPDKLEYRAALLSLRTTAVTKLLLSADAQMATGNLAEAESGYFRVLNLDKENPRAKAGLGLVAQARKHNGLIAAAQKSFEGGDFKIAEEKARLVLAENPNQAEAKSLLSKLDERRSRDKFTPLVLRPYKNPITLEFRDAGIKMIFDILSKTTGINFVLDKDLRQDQRASIFVKQVSLERALDTLLDTNQLEKKIISDNTVLIYPRTPQKIKEYQDLMVKTFYLANADPKQMSNMVRTILKVKDIFVDERLNLMVIRDAPETMHLVEKLVAAQDLPEPEVMLEVEVVEIKRGRLLDLGIQYPLQFGVVNPTPANPLTVNALRHITGATTTVSPSPSVNVRSEITDADILANPRIRVRNREKAKIHIGDRVPVITTSGSQNNTGFISESVQYVDVGIKLEVEPNIYLEGDVAIKVNLEVSSLGAKTVTNNGSVVYQMGTRNATTLLRLKDGETQLLAGLINDEDRKSINGLPGLSEIPLLGRLFSSQQDTRQKTEIVLSITPHLVRSLVRPSADVTQFWSGTEDNNRAGYATAPGLPTMPPMPGQGVVDGMPGMIEPAVPQVMGADGMPGMPPAAIAPTPFGAPPRTSSGTPPGMLPPGMNTPPGL